MTAIIAIGGPRTARSTSNAPLDSSFVAEQSLYRRHRPQSFAEVVGQEHVVRTLSNAIERDRVHHAYLFVGSRGTGKTSMAKILARSLNCVERADARRPAGSASPASRSPPAARWT